MYKGTVSLVAKVMIGEVKFEEFEYKPSFVGIEKSVIKAETGREIESTIILSTVASPEEGKSIAKGAFTVAIDRIVFNYSVRILDCVIEQAAIVAINPTQYSGSAFLASGSSLAVAFGGISIGADHLKLQLECPSSLSERYYGLYRSARLSLDSASCIL